MIKQTAKEKALPVSWAGGPWVVLGFGLAALLLLQGVLLPGTSRGNVGAWGTYAVFFLACGAWLFYLWNGGGLQAVSLDRLAAGGLGCLLLGLAILGSSTADAVAAKTILFYALAYAACLYALFAPSSGFWRGPRGQQEPSAGWGAPLLGLGIGLLILLVYRFANHVIKTQAASDAIFLFFQSRGGSYEGVDGGAPASWSAWGGPLFFFLIGAGLLAAYLARPKAGEKGLVALLYGLALGGKFNVAAMSGTGLRVLEQKITGLGSAYYALSSLIDKIGLYGFVAGFNQNQGRLGTHGESHPFGPEVFYWLLVKVFGSQPGHVAVAIMALCALTVVFIYFFARDHFQSREAGLAAALLYLSSPVQLILSGAGIDCVITLLLAAALWSLQKAARGKSTAWPVFAGALLFCASLLTVGVAVPLLFLGAWILLERLKVSPDLGGLGAGLKTLGLFVGSLVLLHALLWAVMGGHFQYWSVAQSSAPVQLNLSQARPYRIWVWLNIFLYAGYAGVGLVALFVLDLWLAFRQCRLRGTFLAPATGLIMILILTALANAEVERVFHFAALFLVIPAASWFAVATPKGAAGPGPVGWTRGRMVLAAMVALNIVNTLFLEANVLDHW